MVVYDMYTMNNIYVISHRDRHITQRNAQLEPVAYGRDKSLHRANASFSKFPMYQQ